MKIRNKTRNIKPKISRSIERKKKKTRKRRGENPGK
jgi:hypothetical protein